jgi:hypothetical protein
LTSPRPSSSFYARPQELTSAVEREFSRFEEECTKVLAEQSALAKVIRAHACVCVWVGGEGLSSGLMWSDHPPPLECTGQMLTWQAVCCGCRWSTRG